MLNAFAQAASLPGFDTELLNPTERQEAQQIVDQLFSPSPDTGAGTSACAPLTRTAAPTGPRRRHRPGPPRRRPLPGPTRPTAQVWVIYYIVPQQSPILVPVNSWVQVQPVVPTYQWVPVQGTISTGKHSGLRRPWHPWSR